MSDFKSKMCPFLSGAFLASQVQNNVPVAEREVVSCQGPDCAMYLTILDESGKTQVGGSCCFPLTANALSHININTARVAEKVVPGATSNLIAKG